MGALSYATTQDFINTLTNIVRRIRKARLDTQDPAYAVTIDPGKWVVGQDDFLSLQIDGTSYSGFAVVAVYTGSLWFYNFNSSSPPSYMRFLDANDAELLYINLQTLPYQSYEFTGYLMIPPGSLRLALYIAGPSSPQNVVAYF